MAAGGVSLLRSCGLVIADGLWGPRVAVPVGELTLGLKYSWPFRPAAFSERGGAALEW